MKRGKTSISFDRFLDDEPSVAAWCRKPIGFALVETEHPIKFTHAHGGKFEVVFGGDRISNKTWDKILEEFDNSRVPKIVFFEAGTIPAFMNDARHDEIRKRTILSLTIYQGNGGAK